MKPSHPHRRQRLTWRGQRLQELIRLGVTGRREQAERLGVSLAQIDRVRRAVRDRSTPVPAVQTPTVEPALRRIAILMTDREQAAVDPWLVAPDTAHKRVADRRRQSMRLSALFEEFTEYLRVEREATPRTIATYRWCFHDYL